jgi:hypothetical protein
MRQLTAAAFALTAGASWAAQASVEIIAFAHPPVQSALKPLRDWLASQRGKVRVTEIDMESPQGQKRIQALGLKEHLPIVIAVDGQYKQLRADGSSVEFVSFPAQAGSKPGTGWTLEDVKAVVAAAR